MNHTDIKSDGWINRFLPDGLRPYAVLMRLDRPIGIWLLLLPGWWAILLAAGDIFALSRSDSWLMILFGIGAVIMRGAGCVVNDLWDRKLDAQVQRTQSRPLAAGTLTPWRAMVLLGLLLTLGLGILLQMSLVTILLGILAIPLIVAYPLMKRVTWWPQLFLGLTFNFSALMGWAAVTGVISPAALLLYLAGIFWTLGYDTIYAHQDKEDDLRAGIKSTALRLGKNSRQWVGGFYGLSWLFLALAFVMANAGLLSLLILLVAGWHLQRQLKFWESDNPESSLIIFKSNRNFGLIVLFAAAF